ncbi:MAG: nitroreductase family protein [Burkholderiales bacterium]|nr:nitroreductase family protein [Burkholderiales bacterium]
MRSMQERASSENARHDELLQARYGSQGRPASVFVNPTIETLLAHKSVRSFLAEPLPEGAIETMVAAAQSAATSSNLHQWSVVAVTDPQVKAKVWALAAGSSGSNNQFIGQAPVILLWIADISRNCEIAAAEGGDLVVPDYLDAFVMATVDAALAAQNAAVAAESMGLGYCFIGAARNNARELADLLGLPRLSYVTFGLVVGRPDNSKPATVRPRPAQEVVLHFNHYDGKQARESLAGYEPEFSKFREAAGLPKMTWRESVVNSMKFSYMDGREKLRDTVIARGFLLR